MYRAVWYPLIRLSNVGLIDRFYMCSSYEVDITLRGDNEFTLPWWPWISVMHVLEY